MMSMRIRNLSPIPLMLASALTGCATWPESSPGSNPSVREETRTFVLGDCLLNPGAPADELGATEAALVAAIVPPLVDKGLSLTASAIRNAGEKDSYQETAIASTYFYKYHNVGDRWVLLKNERLGCVVVVKGPFGSATHPSFKRFDYKKDDLIERFGLTGDPSFYFEGHIVVSTDRRAFYIRPVHLDYQANLKDGASAERDLVLTFAWEKPAAQDQTVFALATLSYNDLYPGTEITADGHKMVRTRWMPLPSVGEDAMALITNLALEQQAVAKLQGQLEALQKPDKELAEARARLEDSLNATTKHWKLKKAVAKLESARQAARDLAHLPKVIGAKTSNANDLMEQMKALEPVTLRVEVTESKDANKLLLAIADILDGSQDGLKTFAQTQLIPEEKKKAKEQRLAAKEDRILAAEEARIDAAIAQAAYDEITNDPDSTAQEKLEAEKALVRKNLLRDRAFRQAGFTD